MTDGNINAEVSYLFRRIVGSESIRCAGHVEEDTGCAPGFSRAWSKRTSSTEVNLNEARSSYWSFVTVKHIRGSLSQIGISPEAGCAAAESGRKGYE